MRASDLVLVAAFGLAVLIACDRSPTSPRPPLGTATVPYTTQVEVVAPATIAPGTTAQLSAIQHLSDGSKRDVTTGAQWTSENADVLSINSTGLASAHTMGESLITVAIVGLGTGVREIIVVPDGTYRLTGMVGESDNPSLGVADARVEATSGGRNADATITGFDGRYRLYGVSGPTQVRVTKTGYTPLVQTITVVDHQTQDFVLALERPRPSVAGTYTLTITASPSCRNQLPDSARQRTYTAVLTQQGPLVEATLTGATFVVTQGNQANHFSGRVEPQEMTFSLVGFDSYYYYYHGGLGDVVEHIDNTFYLSIAGGAVVGMSGSRFSGRLDGTFQVLTGDLPRNALRTAECRAEDHQFVLAR